ncbi:RNA polymerase sigma factor [Paludisphaera mucosa]|uniref:Sigma-70 family RNA polymerase sigma factor n=1 Tax=Paludisphaera mucosa TaxID=3030827 RepID=A0ABT6FJ74_9BACT|nr:sigma-70 family RNA polymerase sigma factor [Paludisphaera mucosa]MDG3007408.1 sigma-70 family RNA polymerase sigma factor [Paludisphaera mucosa]
MLDAPTVASIPDEVLVQRARGRDLAAREELFLRHRDDAYRTAYRLLGDEADALDAVQESLLKAFSRLDEFDGRGGFRFWLLRIVVNTALDQGRRRKRRKFVTLEGDPTSPSPDDDPARGLQRQDLRRTLDEALGRLSPTLRATFVMFAEAGLSYKEIAEAQDVPIGTVMSRINAARRKLQEMLDWDRLKGLD